MNGGREVLVVDDNPENVRLLAGILEGHGYEVSACLEGEGALRALRARRPDLLLLDVNMPGMDGFAVCEAASADPELRGIPVVMLTARSRTEDVVRGFQAGAVDYVSKPFRTEELLARIRTHMELRRTKEEVQELRSLLPVCSWCHKIRSDDGYWESMERYLQEHGGPRITHGICPDCMERMRADHEGKAAVLRRDGPGPG